MRVRSLMLAVVMATIAGGCGGEESGEPAVSASPDLGIDVQSSPDTATDDAGSTDSAEPGADVPDAGAPDDPTLRILNLDPGVGSAKGGDVVLIEGGGFGTAGGFDGDAIQVFFGASLASNVFVIEAGRLTCTTPPNSPGLVDVTITKPETGETAAIELGFRYEADVLITGVDPGEGDIAGGEPVTITGSGFSQGTTTVLFGDRKAIGAQVVDDTTIHLTTPVGDATGLVDVHVSNDQGVALVKGGFRYTRSPDVGLVVPGAGPTAGGTEVTITGAGFTEDAEVRFGEALATKVTFESPERLLAVAPAGVIGPVAVTVDTDYGTGGLPNAFVYVADEPEELTVVGVSPAKGSVDGGETLTITAYGLTDAQDTSVTIGGVTAQVVGVSPAALSVTVIAPPGTAGPANVTVTNSTGADTLSGGYLYANVVKVLTVSPTSGPEVGGTPITVFGDGFLSGASVTVGALPCAGVEVQSGQSLTCTTPPGSPGAAAVTVSVGPESATLPAAFFYESGDAQLFVVDPTSGSQAGGTYVRLLGAGFEAPANVWFNGNPATHIKVVNSTLITAKTPPGVVGTVDVAVQSASGNATLAEAYTYFDPLALFGGTWGPDVEGAVNVTVLDGGSGEPLPDAFVMLQVDPDTPYQGFSNADGQITFSGPDVLGNQMVSASKEGYESNSVIAFDATNITIVLIPLPPPSSGAPPPGATISGKVFGLGKYVVVPPGDCGKVTPTANGSCAECTSDDDCSGVASHCSTIGETGSFCTVPCASADVCPAGYACLAVEGAAQAQCVPTPGEKQARCYTSMGSIFAQLPTDETPNIVAADGTYSLPSRLGEVAIICLGGFVAWNNPDTTTNFTPVAFGVKRHINVAVGENPGNDVTLNHRLNRTINIRLDDPPFDTEIGPEYLAALVFWDFGSDGGFIHRSFQDLVYGGSAEQVLRVERQPNAFVGDVYDARYQILGVALSFDFETNSQLPASYTFIKNLKQIETDQAFHLEAGHWEGVNSGVTRTVNALWGFADDDVWGVGTGGSIIHYNGGNWSIQATPLSEDLFGVWGPAADDIWAVGADGKMAHFNGVTWTETPLLDVTVDLRGVWGSAADDIFVAGDSWAGIWHYDGTQWTKTSASGAYLRDIHGSDADNVIAVGFYGSVREWNGTVWKSAFLSGSPDLYSVHVVSKTEAYTVGAGGVIYHWDGSAWTQAESPTTKNLRAVWAMGPMDVYAVGDGSTLLHYDGNGWAEQSVTDQISYNALQALWGNPETTVGYALGTSEVLMGPMLQVPQDQVPEDNGVMSGYHLGFDVKPGVPAHFNYIQVAIPGAFGDTPVWSITTEGNVFDFQLPDFANIEGTPGIPSGTYKLTIMRVFKDNFDIDNYDLSDLNTMDWRSWAIDVTYFSK